jgi:tetratricopeptide (TPR) repeat protein
MAGVPAEEPMTTRLTSLLVAALLCLCFGIAARLERTGLGRGSTADTGALAVLLGDSRRLLANDLFTKADAYYHGGYYPGIFDEPMKEAGGAHMLESAGHAGSLDKHEDKDDEDDFLGPPKDWIDRFHRHFFPSKHEHLDKNGDVREILPWLKLSADMNPHLIESYIVCAYWLRGELGKVDEAEAFLREGLRENPGNPDLLLELGRLKVENRKDDASARNVLELSLRSLRARPELLGSTNRFLYAQVLGQLEQLEERSRHWSKAVSYLVALREVTPFKAQIDEQIDRAKVLKDGEPKPKAAGNSKPPQDKPAGSKR